MFAWSASRVFGCMALPAELVESCLDRWESVEFEEFDYFLDYLLVCICYVCDGTSMAVMVGVA